MDKASNLAIYLTAAVLLGLLQYAVQDCDRPINLQNNVVITPDQSSYGTYYSYAASCGPGYDVSGPITFYCTAGSPDYWNPNPSLTVCTATTLQCSKLNITDPDIIITPDKDIYDTYDVITFNCSNGVDVKGPVSASCQEDGTWNYPSESSCPARCNAPANTNGTGPYDNGDEETFACEPGYNLIGFDDRDSDVIMTTCRDGGDWNPPFQCNEPMGCSPPEHPGNVTFASEAEKDDGRYPVHSRVDMACNGEKSPWGPLYSYCNDSGMWQPDPRQLKCYDKCPKPSFDSGDLILTSQQTKSDRLNYFDHTDTVIFSCKDGIFVDGPWRASCKNGTWSPRIGGYRPVCRANCTAPKDTMNEGQVLWHGEAYTFQCDPTIPGLVRLGGPRAFCNDGTWKPNLKCRLKTEL